MSERTPDDVRDEALGELTALCFEMAVHDQALADLKGKIQRLGLKSNQEVWQLMCDEGWESRLDRMGQLVDESEDALARARFGEDFR